MGNKGSKIDFMDRSDQWMVNYYERVAQEAARHHLFVDFHGSFKPAGLEYKYPNVLSYEGSEVWNKWEAVSRRIASTCLS